MTAAIEDLKRQMLGMVPLASPADLAPELPFDDIWTPEPDSNLIIPALGIAPGPAHLVTGSWYTGKTLLLATMGLAVAAGANLFGLYATKQGKWVHFDHEMGRRHLKRYIQRLRAGMQLDVEKLRGNVSLRVLPSLNLTTADAIDHYTRILDGCAMATIDPLRAATPGEDENKSEFRRNLDLLAIVSDRTGCAIEVLHHGGKPVEGAERRNTGRGTSAIDDAVQSKFVLTAKEKGAPMMVTHEKTRELTNVLDDFYLEIDNSKPEAVRLVHRSSEEMGQTITAREIQEARSDTEKGVIAIAALFANRGGKVCGTVDDIRKLTGARSVVVQRGWAELRASGRLQKTGSGDSAAWVLS